MKTVLYCSSTYSWVLFLHVAWMQRIFKCQFSVTFPWQQKDWVTKYIFFSSSLCSFWCLVLSLVFCFLIECGCWLFLLFWKIQPVIDIGYVTFTDNLFLAADVVIWLMTWNLCFELCSGGIISYFYYLCLIVLNYSFSFVLFKEIGAVRLPRLPLISFTTVTFECPEKIIYPQAFLWINRKYYPCFLWW